jgi:c-di-GMP-binding flagellar brake protein YcgR
LDAALVRKKQFDRWGEVQNRRSEDRIKVTPEVSVTLLIGNDKRDATTKDLSAHGMRMQFLEEIPVKAGDKIRVQVHDPKKKKGTLEVEASVMWMEKSGKLRSVWNMGVGFPSLNEEQGETLRQILLPRR